MAGADNRWWGPRSDYPWEEDALRHIHDQMPPAEPYRGWQTFTFTARSGHVREVDLFIATPAGLFLVEIKSHPGRAVNQGGTWLFKQDDHVRAIENPLHLTNRKCQELKSQLGWAADKLGLRTRLPFIQAAVFLSAPDLRCDFDEVQRTMVFGRDGLTEQTGLPGIWAGLLGQPPRSAGNRVDPALSRQLEKLLQKIGVRGLRKHRKIGPFQLEPRAFDTGPTWEDYLAENPALPGDQVRRIRIYLSDLSAPKTERDSAWRAARREYLALQGISHQGIVQAEQFSEEHEAGPAIIFRHGAKWQRLDQFMAEQGAGGAAGTGTIQQGAGLPIETRIEMVRQLAEALDHAHRRHLYHRALAARSVYIEMDGRYPRLRICDWQVAARPGSGSSGPHTVLASGTPTSLGAHIDPASGPYLAPEFGNPESDATQLDVFGLGALTHLILTGIPPAGSRKELDIRLAAERALVPSVMCDEISPAMDDLVRCATGAQPVDRFESVRDFLAYLDLVEEELTRPDQDEIPDLLTAAKGTMMADGWQVGQILGKGSTARALLMTRDDDSRVYKVALSEAGRTRLAHEAAQLKNLRDSHIVRLIDGPKDIGDRTVLILERAGEQTLGQYLRREGRLAIGDLETLGDHLFQAVGYLEGEGIWHRDIKPDNLAIRELNKKGRRLVLFDFSLADTANRATEAGTQHYLDPFLGTDRRPEYDAAAERYAVAVTLHEMASGELPSWGDGVVEARLLDPSEQLPQLAEDSFDPQLRGRLVAFFSTALQRDPGRRYASLRDMSRAWSDVFRALDERRPATTPETVGDLPAAPDDARQVSAARVAASTPLVAAGLSARALSAAEQQLDVSTVGELIKIPAARVQRLRGVGRGPRNELLKRAREWRQQLQVTEQLPDPALADPAGQGSMAGAPGTAGTTGTAGPNATGAAAGQAGAGLGLPSAVAADLATLSLDEIAGQLVPRDNGKNAAEIRVIRLLLALPDAEGRPSPVLAWAPQAAVAAETGLSQPYVGSLLGKARERWTKSVKPVTELRNTVLEILARRSRVMEVGQLAAALLAERGSGLDDPAARLALAQACLRAAIEAEEHLDNPRLGRRRAGTRLLIAAVATAADDPTTPTDDPAAPTEEELLDYAVDLGHRADELVGLGETSPLPGANTVLEALAGVTRPDGMPLLSDTDLVALAAGASQDAAMTARLELYPRSLDPKKALRLAQAASYLGEPGLEPKRLRDRVLARFPELANLPDPDELRKLLQKMGHTVNVVTGTDGSIRYVIPGGTLAGGWSSTRGLTSMAGHAGASTIAETRQRLLAAAEHGGFLAITTKLAETAPVREELTALANVSPVNVTEVFLAALREIVRERGKPRWESVLAADTADAPPAAQAGFGRLLDAVWERLDKQVRAMPGTVMLHDATPLARYAGGMLLLSRLAAGARQADEAPHGLWLLCPMDDPRKPALLDEQTVATLGENEQIVVRPAGQHHEESIMIDHAALLADLKGQVRVLEDDLRTRSADVPEFAADLHGEWQRAHDAERIAAGYEQWLDGEITQAAVSWILGTVFLRFCEDNELIELPYLAGPGERLAIAAERHQAFFEQNPAQTDRDWIIAGFDALADASPVTAGLFDRAHNPMWRITPSHDAAKALLAFWRTRAEGENSPVVHDFEDADWNTRFLGDLYQDLSEFAKKTYALLQTPEFVEEFILDLTLTPALDEFGLEPDPPRAHPDLPRCLRVIDPTCGSGHFLLGAFARLLAQWKQQPAITDPWVLIRNVLDGLHGADKNPFAVSIARFRLLIAAMKAGHVKHLADAPAFPLNIAVADSLVHGRGAPGKQGVFDSMAPVHTFGTEDVGDYIKSADILGVNSYHVVVGNPPYITVKDSAENQTYRDRYATCAGTYALSVPFAERFFNLALRAGGDRRGAGYVGQITSNSFMKREFGKKLIENFLALQVDLTHVIDTSGAYIPGHGTPTVILTGQNMIPTGRSIRAALGIRGEPSQPEDPAKGHVWRAIIDQINEPGDDSEWITVTDLPRNQLAVHPWSLSGGGASGLVSLVQAAPARLANKLERAIGFASFPGQDDVFFVGSSWLSRHRIFPPLRRPLVTGDVVRDWDIYCFDDALVPYNEKHDPVVYQERSSWGRHLWTVRRILQSTTGFGGQTRADSDDPWWTWYRWVPERYATPLSITFAFVATHNHFVLDRGGKVFNRSAPVIKLPGGASEEDHLALLGLLNSSTACFWLKQISQNKGNGGIGGGIGDEAWEPRYEFTGTKLQDFPLPDVLPVEFGRRLDALARRLSGVQPSAVCAKRIQTRLELDAAHAEHDELRGQMIALQEELDWETYWLYGLLTDHEASDLHAEPDSVPELKLGERAFEIVLARQMAAGEIETQWFARHGSTPITKIPAPWPEAYRRVVERRIEIIGKRRDLALIERPECKRRWSSEPWEKKEQAALRSWLLDRCENRALWFALDDTGTEQPQPMTVNRLADRLRDDGEFVSVARLYAGQDAELASVVAEITDAEYVPYLAALRYKDTGLRKRRQWEETWDLQRQEDATGERLDIPVPPKYTSADFRPGSYWSHRGKLDVPKERFISYPQASPDGDSSLLLGWAGWDHRQQAHTLMTIIDTRTSRDGWGTDRLVPLIAGLAEVLPWVRQWHNDIDPVFGMSPADAYAGYLEDQQLRHGVTASDLTVWRPQPSGRGRRAASSPQARPAAIPPPGIVPGTDPVDTQVRHTPTP